MRTTMAVTRNYVIKMDFRRGDNSLLKSAVKYFLDELLTDSDDYSTIHINVTHKTSSSHAGAVTPVRRNNVKWYDIGISRNCNLIDVITTLAHECVHVAQFHEGSITGYVNWYWKGENYGRDPYAGVDDAVTLPWEAEAYSTERILAKKFINNYLNNW